MCKRDWRLFIEDILGAITTIQEYVKEMDFDSLEIKLPMPILTSASI